MKFAFFSAIFKKNSQVSNLTKIRPDGADSFQADGCTDGLKDMMKLTVAFRNFTSSPSKRLKSDRIYL